MNKHTKSTFFHQCFPYTLVGRKSDSVFRRYGSLKQPRISTISNVHCRMAPPLIQPTELALNVCVRLNVFVSFGREISILYVTKIEFNCCDPGNDAAKLSWFLFVQQCSDTVHYCLTIIHHSLHSLFFRGKRFLSFLQGFLRIFTVMDGN